MSLQYVDVGIIPYESPGLSAAQEHSLQETAPTTYEALTRIRPEREDAVTVARQMDIFVPEPVAVAIRRAYEDSLDGSLVRRSRSASLLQVSTSFFLCI